MVFQEFVQSSQNSREHVPVVPFLKPSEAGGFWRVVLTGKLVPLSPGPEYPEDAFQQGTVVPSGTTSLTGLLRWRQQRRKQRPVLIGQLHHSSISTLRNTDRDHFLDDL